jgi:prepilin-type N-terminal cleavage/methylation domain-containing protein
MNRKGFTLVELLAVIVILGIVTVIGVTTVLPYMRNAREDAFRFEATEVVKSAKRAIELINLGQANLSNDSASCYKDNKYCFTISKLRNLSIYDTKNDAIIGKIEVTVNGVNYSYNLYMTKGNEFKFINAQMEDYTKYGVLSLDAWDDSYESCSCD